MTEVSKVGDVRTFYIRQASDNTLEAELRYSGTKCNIWVEKIDEFADLNPNELGEEFDNHIFNVLTENYKEAPDVDGDGKIAIILMDTYMPGYGDVGGYFDSVNFTDAENSNKMEIIHVNAKSPDNFNTTSVHEFQHLVHIGHDLLKEENSHYESWIGEGLSTSAEHTYAGFSEVYKYSYNMSTAIKNGMSLIYFNFSHKTLHLICQFNFITCKYSNISYIVSSLSRFLKFTWNLNVKRTATSNFLSFSLIKSDVYFVKSFLIHKSI